MMRILPSSAAAVALAALLGLPFLPAASAAAAASSSGVPDADAHPFSVDYLGMRLAEAVASRPPRRTMDEGGNATAAPPAEVTTCPEGYDDDATLASHPIAMRYQLKSCAVAYDLLMENLGSSDMLCMSLAAGVCNCTCAGTVVMPSVAVEAVPMSETVDLDPPRDAAFDCDVIRANNGGLLGGDDNIMQPKSAMGKAEKDAVLLRDSVRGWTNCVELSEVGVLLWNVDGETITFAAEFLSEGGAAALGISANGGMYGADLWWVGQDEDGNMAVKDMFSRGYSAAGELVNLDESQDATLVWSEEAEGRLAFEVSRPIKSCDTQDDLEVTAGPVAVLWARFGGNSHMYHGPGTNDRGTVYLDLLNPHNEGIPEDPADLFTADLRFLHGENGDQRFELEDGRVNSYACRSFAMPSDQDYHIVGVEPILDTVPADANVVHHVVLFSCDEDPNLPDPHMCASMNVGCYGVAFAWAVGMPAQYLPEAAGLPMGKFYYMQMHYENLAQESGISDGSGLRLTFTPKLREHDYGYVIVGTSLGQTPALEPGHDDLERMGYCPSECTDQLIPEEGVNVHAQFFHAHLAGRALVTQHIRDGEEIAPLGNLPYYDFNHQFFKQTPGSPTGPTKLLPGDELITTCRYSTKHATNRTKFGVETRDEMCFNMIGVYPAMDTMRYCVNNTAEGGRCGWGSKVKDATAGMVPYVPREEALPDRCDADGADPGTRSSAAGHFISSSMALPALIFLVQARMWMA